MTLDRNNPVRVLQLGKFYPPQRGGMESHLKTLCEGLQQVAPVEVVVSNVGAGTVREMWEGVSVIRTSRLAHLNSTSVNPAMVSAIRQSDADIVHLHWPNPMAALAYLVSGHAGALVVTYHSDVVKQRISRQLFGPVLHAVLRRSRAIILSSQNYLDTSSVLRDYRDRCHVIPFGIPEDHFAPQNEEAVRQIRARYGEKLILSVGRLVDYKGFDVLVRAMVKAPGQLLIVGDGPLRRRFATLARSLKIESRVHFCGEVPDGHLRNLYHACDAFVLASTNRREAFGLVQAEAMAASKPVINTNLDSGVPSVSLDGSTGLTVPHSNPDALGQAITRLLQDPGLRSRLGAAARLRAETMFRASTMSSQTLRTYETILLGHPATTAAKTRKVTTVISHLQPDQLITLGEDQ